MEDQNKVAQCQRWYRINKSMVQRLVEDGVEIIDKMIRCRKPASTKDLEGRFCAKHRVTTPVEGFEPVVEKIEKFEEKYIDYITFKKSAIMYCNN